MEEKVKLTTELHVLQTYYAEEKKYAMIMLSTITPLE